jgi:hypothetical protein
MEKQQIVVEFDAFLFRQGGRPRDWYVGITKNPGGRLFGDHRVPMHEDIWIYSEAVDSTTARAVEAHFLALDLDGGPGGGDSNSKYVYAYRKTAQTRP